MTVAGPVFSAERSELETVTAVCDELFSGVGSLSLLTVAVLVKVVLGGVAGAMWTVRVKSALAPFGREATVQVIVPLLPTPGSLQLKVGPVFWTRDTKVMPAGMASLRV